MLTAWGWDKASGGVHLLLTVSKRHNTHLIWFICPDIWTIATFVSLCLKWCRMCILHYVHEWEWSMLAECNKSTMTHEIQSRICVWKKHDTWNLVHDLWVKETLHMEFSQCVFVSNQGALFFVLSSHSSQGRFLFVMHSFVNLFMINLEGLIMISKQC